MEDQISEGGKWRTTKILYCSINNNLLLIEANKVKCGYQFLCSFLESCVGWRRRICLHVFSRGRFNSTAAAAAQVCDCAILRILTNNVSPKLSNNSELAGVSCFAETATKCDSRWARCDWKLKG